MDAWSWLASRFWHERILKFVMNNEEKMPEVGHPVWTKIRGRDGLLAGAADRSAGDEEPTAHDRSVLFLYRQIQMGVKVVDVWDSCRRPNKYSKSSEECHLPGRAFPRGALSPVRGRTASPTLSGRGKEIKYQD
jgi:hypothetical protein